MLHWLALIPLLLVQVSAAPPVVSGAARAAWTDAERAQLASAVDDSPRLDEGALYVLLERAVDWPAGDLPGAQLPSYDALAAEPAEHRGELFLIEGTLRQTRTITLAKPGPWGEALTEWTVQHGKAPGDVAVIYFVDPDSQLPQPGNGQRVRTSAVFYKVWADRDQNDEPTRYLTFVARSAKVTSAAPGGFTLMPILLAIVGMLALFWVVWRYANRTRAQTGGPRPARRTAQPRANDPAARPEAEMPIDLPEDPAAALDELSRRHAERSANIDPGPPPSDELRQ